jgi:hypothetical protein
LCHLHENLVKSDIHSRKICDLPHLRSVLQGLFICFAVCLFLIFPIYANEIITKSSSVLLLDGVNFREYSLQQSKDMLTLFNRPLLFFSDTSDVSTEKNIAKKPLVSLLADLSSETGEPLFLRLTGGDSSNREHGTYGKIKINIPRIDAQVSGLYCHLGMYADAIEQFCANYEKSRGHSLPYRDMGHYGVAEYIVGQMKLKFRNVLSKTVFNQYGEWITIPGLYNPLYKSGNAATQDLLIPFSSSLLSVSGMVDQRTLYTDHTCSYKKTYYNVNSNYKKVFFSEDTLIAGVLLSNEKIKGDRVGVEYQHSAEMYKMCVSAGFWGAGEPDARVVVSVPFLDSSDASLSYSLVYIPEENAITQITLDKQVSTRIAPFNYNEFRLSTIFHHCLKTPLTIELWTDYKSSFQSYFIEAIDTILSTRFGDSGEKMLLSGGSLNLTFPFKTVDFKLWSSGNIIFTGEPYEYVPYECGIGCTHYFRGASTIQTDFNLTLRGPVHWSATYAGKDSTRTSPRLLFCDIGITIPFILPVLSSHISPELAIKAGPVCLDPSRRERFHPFGSKLGPLVSVTLTGNIF